MTDEAERIRQLFDAAADTYDDVGVEMFGPIAEQLVDGLGPAEGERALDIGCGRGAVLLRLAEAVGPTGRAVGIDLSERMVELTAATAAERGLAVEVAVGEAQRPDVPDAAFDVVASSLVLFFLDDPLEALRAWRMRLVGGGRLGVSTFGPFNPEWHRVDAVFTPYLPPGMRDPRTHVHDSPFGSDHGMEQLLHSARFTEIRTVTTVVPVRFADAEQWHRWTWSTGQRRMWSAVPEAERADVLARATEALHEHRAPDGGLGFDQQVRFTFGIR